MDEPHGRYLVPARGIVAEALPRLPPATWVFLWKRWGLPLHPNCECVEFPIEPGRWRRWSRSTSVIRAALSPEGLRTVAGVDLARLVESGLVTYYDAFGYGRDWDIAMVPDLVRRKGLTREQLRRAGIEM